MACFKKKQAEDNRVQLPDSESVRETSAVSDNSSFLGNMKKGGINASEITTKS